MCESVRMKDGTVAIVCFGHRARRHKCALCGRPATLQCDFPADEGGACDKHLCRGCAIPIGRNRDYCKSHGHERGQGALAL